MKFKNLIKTGLTAILASSLALASPNLPREYDGVRLGYTLDEVKKIYPDGDEYQDHEDCINDESGINIDNLLYHNRGKGGNGPNRINFCFSKKDGKLHYISLIYPRLQREDILKLIEESKKKYGEPDHELSDKMRETSCKQGVYGEPDHAYQLIGIYWVNDSTILRYSGTLNYNAQPRSECYFSNLEIHIINRVIK